MYDLVWAVSCVSNSLYRHRSIVSKASTLTDSFDQDLFAACDVFFVLHDVKYEGAAIIGSKLLPATEMLVNYVWKQWQLSAE